MITNPEKSIVDKQQETGGNINLLSQKKAILISETSLPKGGSAGFSIQLPITLSPNNFSSSLSLSYNSGEDKSLYPLGWSVEQSNHSTKDRQKAFRDIVVIWEKIIYMSGILSL